VKGVVDVRVKEGDDPGSARRQVESSPLKEFLPHDKFELVKKRLTESVERLKRNGYMEWAEKEAYFLFRLEYPEAEAQQKLKSWKR